MLGKAIWTAEARGFGAEVRAINIARQILFHHRGALLPIHCVRKAAARWDKIGFDFFVTLYTFETTTGDTSTNKTFRVPFQVKSSQAGIEKYYKKYPLYALLKVPVIVVNEKRTNIEIMDDIVSVLWDVLKKERRFEWLYTHLKEKKCVFVKQN